MPGPKVGIDYRPALLTAAGIGRSVRELVAALAAQRSVDLHLFGHSLARARVPASIPREARLHRLPIPGRSLPALARLGLDAARLAGSVDVFHWTDYVHPPVTRAARVLTVHDLAFLADPSYHGATTGLLESRCRAAVAAADRVVCPTHATAEMLASELGFPGERTDVIPFGCDHVPAPGRRPLTEPYVVTVGTVEPRKNHGRLLEAWRALGPTRPKLVLIGRAGWADDDTLAEIEAAARHGEILWHRDLPDEAMFDWVAHAELLAYPSRFEGFGFPPLEAMALGTPVLAGDTPALREVLGEAALFCDPEDTADIRDCMSRLLREEPLDRTMRERGRERVAHFTWSACARAHAEAYVRAAGGGARR